ETFLPCDIKDWDKDAVVNAILDDELGKMTRAIAGKGAFVWIIFDSCHSGTALRGGDLGNETVSPFKLRRLSAEELRIPASLAKSGLRGDGNDSGDQGAAVDGLDSSL